MKLSQDAAETIGLKCLAWLAEQEDLLPVFMGATGASVDDLRNGAKNADFIGAVLDFVLMDDAWIEAFCTAGGLPNDMPMRARAMLPGGAQMNWT
ncbi:DUF3572 domain-containing protein [Roseovarius sp. EL26]|uniref:DUF3572 domain-containing protein n=1 Tax=Roseovarius sp. EL26 TaxID=2126672 RepID=UPI000EA07BDD|nr:DUF3572 domain-containing protein [Roseovarius sp. EL26]